MLYQLRGKKKTFEVGASAEVQIDGEWVRGVVVRVTNFHVEVRVGANLEAVEIAMSIYSARNKLCFVDIRGV